MTDVFVSNICYSLGSQRFSVEESEQAGRTLTAAPLLRDAGFAQHWVSAEENAFDLASAAVTQMGNAVADTDGIIHATCLPLNANVGDTSAFQQSGDVKQVMDYPVSRLQASFGLDRALVMGVGQQACTSLLGSLRVAKAMMQAESELKQFLCVTADRFPPGALYEQAYSLISDGAAGCLLTRDEGEFRLLQTHHIANGALVQASDDETVGAYFSYTHRSITELLDRAGRATNDISWIVPQNTNRKAWQVLARLLGVNEEKVWCPTLPEVGHMISGDNLVNLLSLSRSGEMKPGDLVLLTMAGYGMNWQATLLEKM